MKIKSFIGTIISFLFIGLLFVTAPVFAQEEGEQSVLLDSPELPRRALVVGNASYEAGPLKNPKNDAKEMAVILEKAGFDVMLRTDRSLEEMEKDLRSFRDSLEEGETALFFYAGHGVQFDGDNYLLPIDNKGIQDSMELKRRAILARNYITAMTEAEAGLNIVMLDACRDNPLPAESRGGSRGLSVMSAPRNSETVIVFATKAGRVAQDGDGENSTFTEAFIETVKEPDLSLMDLFNKVGAKVKEQTGGSQVPTIYSEPLSRSFNFFSSKRMAERARRASRKAQEELSRLEQEIAERQQKIEQAENERERKRLEVEQQRRKAKLAAQKLEAKNLEREVQKREEDVAAAEAYAKKITEERARALRQQEKLEKLAAARRKELENLSQDVQSENPDVLIETIERLERVLEEIEQDYEEAWETTEEEIKKTFVPSLAAIKEKEPEIWESDDDFEERIARERLQIQEERDEEIEKRRETVEKEKEKQTSSIRGQLQKALTILDTHTWTLKGSDIELMAGEYNRNARRWPFYISSREEAVPVPQWKLEVDFSWRNDFKEDLLALDKAVKAEGLTAEIEWKIDRRIRRSSSYGPYGGVAPKKHRYYVVMEKIVLRDLTRAKVVTKDLKDRDIAYFDGAEKENWTSLWGWIDISSMPHTSAYFVDNEPYRAFEGEIALLERDYRIKAQWEDGLYVEKEVKIEPESRRSLSLDKKNSPMVFVEGGSFEMGSDKSVEGDEKPVHSVTVDSFYLQKTEVPFEQYDEFVRATGHEFPDDNGWGRGNRPAIDVSWYDAVEYANWLSKMEGLEPAYVIHDREVKWKHHANGWRLPTEAEWEYAASGGKSGKNTIYAGSDKVDEVAWYGDTSGKQTSPIAQKEPNELGVYDMSGNVWEWCWDYYSYRYYEESPVYNPIGPENGRKRSLRGGSFSVYGQYGFSSVRVPSRTAVNPLWSSYHDGFRLVRSAED